MTTAALVAANNLSGLHKCLGVRQSEAAEALVAAGADEGLVNCDGMTAVQLAERAWAVYNARSERERGLRERGGREVQESR